IITYGPDVLVEAREDIGVDHREIWGAALRGLLQQERHRLVHVGGGNKGIYCVPARLLPTRDGVLYVLDAVFVGGLQRVTRDRLPPYGLFGLTLSTATGSSQKHRPGKPRATKPQKLPTAHAPVVHEHVLLLPRHSTCCLHHTQQRRATNAPAPSTTSTRTHSVECIEVRM